MSYTKEHTEDECDRCLKDIGWSNLKPLSFLLLDRGDTIHPDQGGGYRQYHTCEDCWE